MELSYEQCFQPQCLNQLFIWMLIVTQYFEFIDARPQISKFIIIYKYTRTLAIYRKCIFFFFTRKEINKFNAALDSPQSPNFISGAF